MRNTESRKADIKLLQAVGSTWEQKSFVALGKLSIFAPETKHFSRRR